MTNPKVYAFTQESEGIADALYSEVGVLDSTKTNVLVPFGQQKIQPFECIGLWDTGAMKTVITDNVIDALALPELGIAKSSGVSGIYQTTIHMIDLMLPNGVVFPRLSVTKGILGTHFDVLIGMDVISRGDFAISNYQGKTAFTFRIPSLMKTDYVQWQTLREQASSSKIDRNAQCPCGSGRKFKHCCGRSPTQATSLPGNRHL